MLPKLNKTHEIDFKRIRKDFLQIEKTLIHGKPLIYLDSAASSLKPKQVVDAIAHYYQYEASNIHRGVHFLSEYGTSRYEDVRTQIQEFIHAQEREEVLFTRGTTDSINLVAKSFGKKFLNAGDEIIISEMEHHSGIVPWQMLCEEKGCVLKVIPMNDQGELILDAYKKLLTAKTKIVSVVYISNSLGTVNPVKEIIDAAHKVGAKVLIDGAQAIAHKKIDVQALDCDFFAFSGHKIFGPTGIGVLYGKRALLEGMPPVQGGGDMIDTVTFEKTTYNVLPYKFEAGTPHVAGVIGLGVALDYIKNIGLETIAEYEQELLHYATEEILKIDGVKIIGTAKNKGPILSFVMAGAHASDIGTLIDMEGVAIRTGHHCTQPIMQHFGISATARASFSVYNNKSDVDVFIAALKKIRRMF